MSKAGKPTQASRNLHYIHRLDYTAQERLTGLFILGAIALLVLGLGFGQQSSYFFADTFELTAYMKNAQGISNDTQVKAAGIEIGRVKRIDISEDNRIAVTMQVLERFHELIRADSTASLNKLSMLGDATIEISSGSETMPPIAQGGVIAVKETASMDELIAQVTPALESLVDMMEQLGATAGGDGKGSVRQLLADSGTAVENLKTVTERLSRGEGVAGRLLADEKLATQLDASMASLERALGEAEQRFRELGPVISDGSRASADLPAVTQNINELVKELSVTLREVNEQLTEIPELVARSRMLMDQANRTMEAVQNTWPISGSLPAEEKADAVDVQPPNN
ncbi:MAG: MlaD family protein [Gammaproteobacteria bacterium]|nr:MlaD family protein [Gammaproteobacteria bacterium]